MSAPRRRGPSGLDPMAVAMLASAYWGARVLHTAQRLNLFTHLRRPSSPAELAAACQVSERGVLCLLPALAALGFLTARKGRYRLAPLARHFLLPSSPRYQGGIVSMFDGWYDAWRDLSEAVATGKPVAALPHEQDPEAVRRYVYGMHHRGLPQARLLIEKISLRGRARLLDVAGGPGTFSALFCRRTPGLTAVVMDLPQTLAVTREIVGRTGGASVRRRVTLQPGNYLTDPFGHDYDVVLLSSIFNQEPPEVLRSLLRKAYRALVPGGLILLQEQFLNPDRTGPVLPALIGVNQLIHTPGGRSYSGAEIKTLAEAAGFRKVRFVPMHSPFTVLRGIRP